MSSMILPDLRGGLDINNFVAQLVASDRPQLLRSFNVRREHEKTYSSITESFKSALLAVHSALVALTIASDKKAASDAINTFITSYNHFIGISKQFWSYNAQTRQQAAALEDSTLLKIQGELSHGLTRPILDNSALNLLDEVGVKIQADGTLSDFVDKFNRAHSKKHDSDVKSLTTLFDGHLDNTRCLDKMNSNLHGKLGKKNKSLETKKQKTAVRISAEEARYRREFNTLDNLLSSLRHTNNFLTQKLSTLSSQSSYNY